MWPSILLLLIGAISGLFLFRFLPALPKRRQDEEEEEEEEEGEAFGEVQTCDALFVSGRREPRFYKDNGFGEPVPCDNPKTLSVPERVSIPIYWTILGNQWTPDQAQAKMDEAATWFARYCISLTKWKLNLKANEPQELGNILTKADGQGWRRYNAAVERVYNRLRKHRMGGATKFLLILFVDTFEEVRYERRIDKVAGNFTDLPVILVPASPDIGSTNIVTHELIHGLGKIWRDPPSTIPYTGAGQNNTWTEGACANEMGNSGRANPTAIMTRPGDAPMDWASYIQFGPAHSNTIM